MKFDRNMIATRLTQALMAEEYDDQVAASVAFHMTDWIEDLEALSQLFKEPERFASEEIDRMLIGFLTHVPNHVAAAAKLLNDTMVSDIFGVGAVPPASEES